MNRDVLWKAEAELEVNKWSEKIPFIQFPSSWFVKPIYPFAGAMTRFLVSEDEVKDVSVYLDCHNNLGYADGPYWEVYPVDDGTARCKMEDVESLLKFIQQGLEQMRGKDDGE